MFPALPTDEFDVPHAHALTTLPPCTTQENDWDEAWEGAAAQDDGFWKRSADEEAELTEPTLTLGLDPDLRAAYEDDTDSEPLPMPAEVIEVPVSKAVRLRHAISRLFRSRVDPDEKA